MQLSKAEAIIELYGHTGEILFAVGLNDAIIGYDEQSGRVVYSRSLILEILEEVHNMCYDEAVEYYDFNIMGAYMGEKSPIYVSDDYPLWISDQVVTSGD